MTMRIHHGNHHAAYVNNLNGLAEKWPDLATKPIEEILSNLSVAPEALRTGIRNNLGGHWNHTLLLDLMTPGGAKAPTEDVKSAIDGAFGDVDKMKAAVKQAGLRVSAPAGRGSPSARTRSSRSSAPPTRTPRIFMPAPSRSWHRRVGTRLLPQTPVQARRLHRHLVEHGELGQGRGQLQKSHGVKLLPGLSREMV